MALWLVVGVGGCTMARFGLWNIEGKGGMSRRIALPNCFVVLREFREELLNPKYIRIPNWGQEKDTSTLLQGLRYRYTLKQSLGSAIPG